MEFIQALTIWQATGIIVAAIILNAGLAVVKTFKPENENFDIRKLPQFVAEDVFPYVGGLLLVAITADRVGNPFDQAIFYPIAVPVLLKYIVQITDKVKCLFGIEF